MSNTVAFKIIGNADKISKILINAGAEPNAETVWGDTAVHYAAISGTLDTLMFLVESGGKVSKDMSKIQNGLNLCDEYGLAEVKIILLH